MSFHIVRVIGGVLQGNKITVKSDDRPCQPIKSVAVDDVNNLVDVDICHL